MQEGDAVKGQEHGQGTAVFRPDGPGVPAAQPQGHGGLHRPEQQEADTVIDGSPEYRRFLRDPQPPEGIRRCRGFPIVEADQEQQRQQGHSADQRQAHQQVFHRRHVPVHELPAVPVQGKEGGFQSAHGNHQRQQPQEGIPRIERQNRQMLFHDKSSSIVPSSSHSRSTSASASSLGTPDCRSVWTSRLTSSASSWARMRSRCSGVAET